MKIRTQILLTTLFCYCFITEGFSQSYFNSRYDFYNENNGSINFISNNDTFYLPVQFPSTGKSTIGKISKDGNLLLCNRYTTSFAGSYYFSNAITQNENKIYTTGNGGYFNKITSPLYKHKLNGDTLKTIYFGDTAYYVTMQKIIVKTNEKNKLLLVGITDSTCGSGHQGLYKPIIRVVDTNGVLYQTKIYLSDCKYRNITSIDTAENKGYLIGFGGVFGTWDIEAKVLKLDSNLNVIWDKQINLTSEGAPQIVNHKNKYYTMLSTKVDSVWNFTYKWERVSLTRLDLNGNIIWQKYYGIKERPMLTSRLKECSNGDFLLCGTRRTAYNELQGWIMRTDSIGNLKWWRNYRPKTTPILDTVADNYLHDIMELPNGDIAAVGWAGQSSISPLQQTWLLKVDSNGCFGTSSCPPNFLTGLSEKSINSVGLTAYPNPFKDELNINYTILDFEGVAQLQLIELATGRIIDTIELTQSFGTKQFNTQYLANGLYVLSLKQNNKPSVNFKVINIR